MNIEIISIGGELVAGRARDTSGSYMAEKLSGAGITVGRITLVGNCVEDIVSLIREAMKRGTRVLILSGGLGPGPDDVTLAAVAEAAGARLLSDPAALRLVKERYDDLFTKGKVPIPHLPPEGIKMASLPSGATLLENRVGITPGIKMRAGVVTLYCLPGEPEELKGIFEKIVYPEVVLLFGGGAVEVRRIGSRLAVESDISRIAGVVEEKFPSISVKVRSVKVGGEKKIVVEFIAADEGKGEASQMEKAMRCYQELELREEGDRKWIAE